MAARQVQRTHPHRVMKGSRDCGALGCSLHKMKGWAGPEHLQEPASLGYWLRQVKHIGVLL